MTFAVHALRYLSASALQKGLGFAVLLWLAVHLSVRDYALVGLLIAVQTGVAAFSGSGVIEVLLGELRELPEQRAKCFQAAMEVFVLLVIVSLLFIGLALSFLCRYLGVGALDVFIVALSGILTAFFLIQSQLSRLEEAHRVSTQLGAVPPVLSLLSGLAFILVWGGVPAFFSGVLVGLIVSIFLFRDKYLGLVRFSTISPMARTMTQRSAPFIAIAILSWIMGYGANYIINPMFSDTESARFTFAYTLSSGMQLVATSVNQVWNPRFFRIVHVQPLAEVERASARYFLWLGLILGVAGAALLLALTSLQLVVPALGKYQNLSLELFFLLLVYTLSLPWYHAQNYYFAHAEGGHLLRLMLYSSLLSAALWFSLILYLGVVGVYVGFPLQMLVRAAFVSGWGARRWSIGIPWQGTVLAVGILGFGLAMSKWLAEWLESVGAMSAG